MEESFKNMIIIILIFVLLYLIYNKLNKYSNIPKLRCQRSSGCGSRCQRNLVHHQQIYQNPVQSVQQIYQNPVQSVQQVYQEPVQQVYQEPVYEVYQEPVYEVQQDESFRKACQNEKLISINSNSITSNSVSTNMSDHELIHMHDSKPFITNEDTAITNNPEINAVELEPQQFNYIKDFDPENFNYFDPTGLYNIV